MKKAIAILGLLSMACTAFAETNTADRGSLFMVSEVHKQCSEEFSQALSENKTILGLTREVSKNEQGRTVITFQMSTGYTGSPMGNKERVLNILTLTETAHAVQPADGFIFDSNCNLQK